MKNLAKHKKLIILSAAALSMTAALTLEHSLAYFTTYVSAGGSQVVHMGARTEIHEDVSNMTKHISITNTSETNDCFVRVRVFYEADVTVTCSPQDGWYDGGDDYWYYSPILAPGASTAVLDAKITVPAEFDKDSFNVVVIHECTPVIYDEDGNPAADWNTTYSEYTEIED